MTAPFSALRGVFVRPAIGGPGAEPAAADDGKVVPLRRDADLVRLRLAANASRPRPLTERDCDLAPQVVVVHAGDYREPWLAAAVAGSLGRLLAARPAFVTDAALDCDPAAGQARLRFGNGRLTLPFAARRRGPVWRIGEQAAKTHGSFLRALGPVVWSVGGIGDAIDDGLAAQLVSNDGVVLARAHDSDPAYTGLVAGELRTVARRGRVVRVAAGGHRRTDADDDEIWLPVTAADRWRIALGMRAGGRLAAAVDEVADALLDA